MATSYPMPAQGAVGLRSATRSSVIPWYLWCAVVSVTSAIIGGHWDISWHRSIGRDTFWTPAHIAIYLCGVLAGVSCGYLILSRTFGKEKDGATVGMWGFRGPLGAFLGAWGGVAMLTSAPFDDWWHNAYGLDVKIVSPPHVLLMMGTLMIMVGALVVALGHMNRAEGSERARLNGIFLYVGAMILILLLVFLMEFTTRVQMRQAQMYQKVALLIPVVLVGLARASELRWAATITAGIYTVFLVGFVWILPLFPAEPKLGPVYVQVTHFIPPEFPLLLLAPAVALDVLRRRLEGWGKWAQALVMGLVFCAVFVGVQWPFADFLMGPGARNWMIGSHYLGYYAHPNSYLARNEYVASEAGFAMKMALVPVLGIVSARLGLGWGDWMRKIKR